MEPDAITRRLAAILCADVQGYSRLMGADEEGTLRELKACHELMSGLIGAHRGRVVNAPGDSVLAEFPSVVDAVSCAAAIQDALERRAQGLPQDRRMAFRIGVNLGDVMVQGEAIYGDGVNVAARLESLAPGNGICISGAAWEQVAGKLNLRFEDLGEHQVKNIARPVRVYRVLREGEGVQSPAAVPGAGGGRADAPPGQPAIAVLPFQNMSGDPEQEYFSDGITEDIITDLSRLPGLVVIARNSTFTYKGKPVDVRRIGREFGVTHVLEGSVRRAGTRVRVTAQLVAAATGHHLWAERFDRDFEDIFALQDEITRRIVAALDVKMLRGEQAFAWRRLLHRPEALDAYYCGLDLVNRITREANAQAARCFEDVCRLEPESPLGWIGMAWTHLSASRYGWSESSAESLERAAALARTALELDEACADAHALLGYHHLVSGRHEEAIAAGERSVALNPNHADNAANLACSYAVSGRPAQAIELLRRAMRLSPIHPTWYLNVLGFAHFLRGEHEEAERVLRRALAREPGYSDCRLILAAALHARGETDAARREAREVLRHDPAFTLSNVETSLSIVKDGALVARLLGTLRELGLA
ncbi:MAG: adenylate/guanylate cyclase domain-containing protein [Pseudomonadota bacterium]